MTLYQRLMGEKFKELNPKIQAMHSYENAKVLKGSVDIVRGNSLMAKVLSMLMMLPKSQNNAVMKLEFMQKEEKELWTRTFGSDTFSSLQYEHNGFMIEQIGLIKLYFEIRVENSSLITRLTQIRFLGLKTPKIFTLNITSKQEILGDDISFRVEVTLPKGERVIEYFGIIKE